MNYFPQVFVVVFLSVSTGCPALAQAGEDSLFVTEVTQKAISRLLNFQKTDGPLYNGKMHHPHPKFKDGEHTSFINDHYTQGTIVYDGLTYKDLSVMYDLVRDQLLLLNKDSSGGIVVQPDHVDFFSLHNHNFVNIKPGTASKNVAPGYYDLLYNGQISLLVRRVKKVTEKVSQYVEKVVEQTTTYYLFKDSVYIRIRDKKHLIRLLNATQNENKAYIKAVKLDFNRNKEDAMLRLVSFHDSLNR